MKNLSISSEEPRSSTPYSESIILSHLKKSQENQHPLRIAFFDIDSTLTGAAPKAANMVRKRLTQLGYSLVFVTSRTEEMVMSGTEFRKSQKFGFSRPEPRLSFENGRFSYIPPEDYEPLGVLDPDIIVGSSGTKILIRQKNGGYIHDISFEKRYSQKSHEWRIGTLQVISYINSFGKLANLSAIDIQNRYDKYETNVFPPDYRIQLFFDNLEAKKEFLKRMYSLKNDSNVPKEVIKQIIHMDITDDSNPIVGKYFVHVTPPRAKKVRATEHIVKKLCKLLGIKRSKLDLLIAGDSYADLSMGLFGGLGTNATFIVVGGSRLSHLFIEKEIERFAGEKITFMKKRLCKGDHCYEFEIPFVEKKRKIVIGDEFHPKTKGPETILSFLDRHASYL